MANPSINELQNPDEFEIVAELNHNQIKEFVIDQLSGKSTIVRVFMFYQVFMILLGIFFLTRSFVLAFHQNFNPLFYSLSALVFSFTLLIVIHELLHGVALKLTGAKHINFGGYLKKFIFYAEADQHVLNRKQFAFVALTPFLIIKILTFTGIILFMNQPVFYAFIFIMSAHSLFCAGDIGLLSIFYKYKNDAIYTYDVKKEKTSYYYKAKQK